MDASTLDRLAHMVGGSRRAALRTALGGAAVAAAGIGASGIGCDAKKKKCKKRKKNKCKGKARDEACSSNKECCTNETNLACSVRNAGAIETVCCGALGAGCDADDDCCVGFRCDIGDGECVADAP